MPRVARRFLIPAVSAAALLILPAYLRAYKLSGASDAPTLLLGDKVIVNQAAYGVNLPYTSVRMVKLARPKRGDLVLMQSPDRPLRIFKRVIGLPGETIGMRDHRVTIDGQLLPLRPISTDIAWVPPAHHMGNTIFDEDGHWIAFTPGAGENRDLGPVRLKSDEYFLMGDNRDVSLDCRAWGPIKESAIYGKVIFTMASRPRNQSAR